MVLELCSICSTVLRYQMLFVTANPCSSGNTSSSAARGAPVWWGQPPTHRQAQHSQEVHPSWPQGGPHRSSPDRTAAWWQDRQTDGLASMSACMDLCLNVLQFCAHVACQYHGTCWTSTVILNKIIMHGFESSAGHLVAVVVQL